MIVVARLLPLAALALLMACADGRELGPLRPELDNFLLAHNIVLETNTTRGPLSRAAPEGAWTEVLTAEVARRFGRYDGDRYYHIAINVDAYVLAMPGIPLVVSPRSILILGVHVWDDALGRPLNDERHQITVFESLSGETVLGSGLTQSAEVQMANLARNAVLQIENWMVANPEWFPPRASPDESGAAAAPEAAPPAGTARPVVRPPA